MKERKDYWKDKRIWTISEFRSIINKYKKAKVVEEK